MLRRTLSILLVACALLTQSAWLSRFPDAMSAEEEARVLCVKAGLEGEHGAPAPHSSPDRCASCLACGVSLLALAAVILVLADAGLFQAKVSPFVRRSRLLWTSRRAWRPPVRAPPVFS